MYFALSKHDLDLLCYLGYVLMAFVIGFIVGRLAFGTFREQKGELMVINAIRDHVKIHYHLINDVHLPWSNVDTSMINHIMVTPYGIFVIETKWWKVGFLSGSSAAKEWRLRIGRTWAKNVLSPVWQNEGHIKTLQRFFDFPADYFVNLVVFAGDCHLDSDFGFNVIYLRNLKDYFSQPRDVILSEKQMAYIVGVIEMNRKDRSRETREQHVNTVRARMEGF